jgi:protein-tyrosine phosphatase
MIEEGLFLGSLDAAEDPELLEKHNITCVLSILDSFRGTHHYGPNITHKKITLVDSPAARIIDHLPHGLKFISEALNAGKNILVHCAAGISRSASMVIAFLMVKYSCDFETAKRMVREKRACIWPNQGFENQLKTIDIENYKEFVF